MPRPGGRRLELWARPRWAAPLATLALLGAPLPMAAAITGICPDGSVYIVQRVEQIPCAESKRVQPHEVPPVRPEYLPSPYTWQVWSQGQSPNNPYNLLDAAREVRRLAPGSARPGPAPGEGLAEPGASGSPPPEAAAPALPDRPLDLGLDDAELRSLFQIVELSQEQHPVHFARNTADGRGVFRVAFSRSRAFEARLRQAWETRGGLGGSGVLLFTAFSRQPFEFHANLTFVQDHLTYQPDPRNARQLGILQGRLGALEAGEAVLGYVVLPETLDPAGEMDLYWNDRRTVARFAP